MKHDDKRNLWQMQYIYLKQVNGTANAVCSMIVISQCMLCRSDSCLVSAVLNVKKHRHS